MTLYESYGIVVAFAVGATFVLTFPVRWIAVRFGAVDHPGEHRVHSKPTPVIGGAAMLLAFCASIELASRLEGGASAQFRKIRSCGDLTRVRDHRYSGDEMRGDLRRIEPQLRGGNRT